MTDPYLHEIFSHAGKTGAEIRLATMGDAEKQAMTEKARAAKDAKYLEQLKLTVDPDNKLTDEERTRRARHLMEAQRAKARLDAVRRERNRRLLAAAEDLALLQSDAS